MKDLHARIKYLDLFLKKKSVIKYLFLGGNLDL